MPDPESRHIQLQPTEHEYLHARVYDVADQVLAYVQDRDHLYSPDFPAQFREVVAGLIGARLLAPMINGLRSPGDGPPIVADLDRRTFEHSAGWWRGPDGASRFSSIVCGDDTPALRRKGILRALEGEIFDAAGGGDAGEDAMHEFYESGDVALLTACGLDETQAARTIQILRLPESELTVSLVDELEDLMVRSTSGYRMLATPAGLAKLEAHMRGHARRVAARLLSAAPRMTAPHTDLLRRVKRMTDGELTPPVVNSVNRIASELADEARS